MFLSPADRGIRQLISIALHIFVLGAFLFASRPAFSDLTENHLPARDTALVSLKGFIDGVVLSRGFKGYDSNSEARFLAAAVLHRVQVLNGSTLSTGQSSQALSIFCLRSLIIRSPPSSWHV
jgi:hypothetical protein